MSMRWYPIYQRGNPQLRIFLPNFWMKLVKPKHPLCENVVQFSCPLNMTKHDIREYLTKIYNIPVVQVRTRIKLGAFRKVTNRQYIMKEDDEKLAFVTLPEGEKFVFPDLFPTTSSDKDTDDHNKGFDETKANFRKYLNQNKDRPGLPNWFSI